jgi:L-ascorbate metabolism protein UlaG (beta-lactamase superfamily)
MDPIPGAIGYTPPANLKADAVTVSHEHGDHNNVALVSGVKGDPKILRGLSPDKKNWVKTEEKIKDVAIRSVGVYHDDQQGKLRGLNSVFVFETGGMRIAHLGDLGHLLTDAHLQQIGPVDVVLVPVGGVFTIDAAQASKVIEQLKPRTIVVPMHYRARPGSGARRGTCCRSAGASALASSRVARPAIHRRPGRPSRPR